MNKVVNADGIVIHELTSPRVVDAVRNHPVHELCAMFPGLSLKAFAELEQDIGDNGVLYPIVLLEGQVLDGRHRMEAAARLEIKVPVVDYVGDDPVAFVKSMNGQRRHLAPEEWLGIIVKLDDYLQRHPGRPATDNSAHVRNISSASGSGKSKPTKVADLVADTPVSKRTAENVLAVKDKGDPKLLDMVVKGEVAPRPAAEVASLPASDQKAIVEKGPEAVKAAAKVEREKKAKPKAEPKPKAEKPAADGEVEKLRARVKELEAENAELRTIVSDMRSGYEELSTDVEAQDRQINALMNELGKEQPGKFTLAQENQKLHVEIKNLNHALVTAQNSAEQFQKQWMAESRRAEKLSKAVKDKVKEDAV